MDLEHPMVTQINRTGYPENMMEQPEHNGIDYYGTEILEDDDIVIDDNGEIILKENLEEYLSEVYGFKFTTAE